MDFIINKQFQKISVHTCKCRPRAAFFFFYIYRSFSFSFSSSSSFSPVVAKKESTTTSSDYLYGGKQIISVDEPLYEYILSHTREPKVRSRALVCYFPAVKFSPL